MSNFYINLVNKAIEAIHDGYNPPHKPACAYFVSQMMINSGWKGELTGWVPTIYDMGIPIKDNSTVLPGDLVIFENTYIQADKTHIGILLEKNNGVWEFAHYSSSFDAPIISKLEGYWPNHFETFLRLPDPIKTKNYLKMFYHDKAFRPKIIYNGNEYNVNNMIVTITTIEGKDFTFNSHPYENNPCLSTNDGNFPVISIGEKGIEYKK